MYDVYGMGFVKKASPIQMPTHYRCDNGYRVTSGLRSLRLLIANGLLCRTDDQPTKAIPLQTAPKTHERPRVQESHTHFK